MNTVKAIIFDIGGVVVELDFPGMFERVAARSSKPLDVIKGEFWPERGPDGAYRETTLGRATCGDIDRREILKTVHERIGFQGEQAELDMLYGTLFPGRIEGTIAIMESLKGRYPVGIISNISDWSWPHCLKLVPELGRVEFPFLSFREKMVKPDPALFLRAAERMGFLPSEVVFIDDTPDIVERSCAVGLQGILFTGVEELRAELVRRGVEIG